ncbi:MAG: Bug family tripartite tricarboxylate transporter substrate binding protein [Nocardioidaceae bacterium]
MRTSSPQTLRRSVVVTTGLALVVAAAGCEQSSDGGGGGETTDYPSETIEIMVPAAAGGGWDLTGRNMQKVLQDEDISSEPVEVVNVEGGGGATGLSQLTSREKGNAHELMITGLVMIGALEQANSPVQLNAATPIATLTAESEAFVVPADSPYQSIADVVAAYEKDPKSVTFGGGSAGGSDHLVAGQLVQAAGAEPADLKYVGYSGGGEATAGILSGDVAVGVSGLSEFEPHIESGKMRLLAISTTDEIEVAGKPAPTLKDEGYDVDFANWRAVVAPPDISDGERDAIIEMVDTLHESEGWKAVLEEQGWTDFYRTGDEAKAYIDEETERISGLMEELGL